MTTLPPLVAIPQDELDRLKDANRRLADMVNRQAGQLHDMGIDVQHARVNATHQANIADALRAELAAARRGNRRAGWARTRKIAKRWALISVGSVAGFLVLLLILGLTVAPGGGCQ